MRKRRQWRSEKGSGEGKGEGEGERASTLVILRQTGIQWNYGEKYVFLNNLKYLTYDLIESSGFWVEVVQNKEILTYDINCVCVYVKHHDIWGLKPYSATCWPISFKFCTDQILSMSQTGPPSFVTIDFRCLICAQTSLADGGSIFWDPWMSSDNHATLDRNCTLHLTWLLLSYNRFCGCMFILQGHQVARPGIIFHATTDCAFNGVSFVKLAHSVQAWLASNRGWEYFFFVFLLIIINNQTPENLSALVWSELW